MAALLIRDDGSTTAASDFILIGFMGDSIIVPAGAAGCAETPKASIPQPLSEAACTCGDGVEVAATFSTYASGTNPDWPFAS